MPFDGEARPCVLSGGQTAARSAVVLDKVEFLLDGGAKWARRTLETIDGRRCLLGAIQTSGRFARVCLLSATEMIAASWASMTLIGAAFPILPAC